MARGRGRGVVSRVGKSSDRNNSAIGAKISTIPISTIISPQQGGTSSIPSSTPVTQTFLPPATQIVTPSSLATSTQCNTRGEGTSIQNNPISEGDSSSSHARTLITLTFARLEPSRTCSSLIYESFKNEVDPNGINWKGVSNEIRDGYFGEFKIYFRNIFTETPPSVKMQ